MAPAPDPRPLTREPLALDLVDTVWVDDAGSHDLLDDPAQRSAWLARWRLGDPRGRAAATHLAEARDAIRALLEHPADSDAVAAVDAVLGRGRIRLHLQGGKPGESVEVPPAWAAAWHAARDLRRLLAERPDRVKRCANPDCVLWFHDITRSGTRRWCSMTGGCGSRLKARRHLERSRAH
jgi:predicted RNA-binding Zn ribbon-like protein